MIVKNDDEINEFIENRFKSNYNRLSFMMNMKDKIS